MMLEAPLPSIDPPAPPDWRDRYPWLVLLSVARLATNPPILVVAALGALIGSLGWWLGEALFIGEIHPHNVPLQVDTTYLGLFPGQRLVDSCPFGCYEFPIVRDLAKFTGPWPDDPVLAMPYRMTRPFFQLARPGGSWSEFAYYLFGGLWTLLVWSVFGAAITRMAVLQIGCEEPLDPVEALRFGVQRMDSHLAAGAMPLAVIMLLAMPFIILGWIMRLNFGVAVIGLLYGLMLPVGLLIAVVALGWFFAWPLVWGSLSSDGMDAFDAISRAYSYSCQRPLRYLGYILLAMAGGILAWLLVWAISELIIYAGLWAITVGAGSEQMSQITTAMNGQPVDSNLLQFGSRLFAFWNGVIRTLATAFAYSYFWCAFAGIYLLLRYEVDSTEMDEVFHEKTPRSIQELTKAVSPAD